MGAQGRTELEGPGVKLAEELGDGFMSGRYVMGLRPQRNKVGDAWNTNRSPWEWGQGVRVYLEGRVQNLPTPKLTSHCGGKQLKKAFLKKKKKKEKRFSLSSRLKFWIL